VHPAGRAARQLRPPAHPLRFRRFQHAAARLPCVIHHETRHCRKGDLMRLLPHCRWAAALSLVLLLPPVGSAEQLPIATGERTLNSALQPSSSSAVDVFHDACPEPLRDLPPSLLSSSVSDMPPEELPPTTYGQSSPEDFPVARDSGSLPAPAFECSVQSATATPVDTVSGANFLGPHGNLIPPDPNGAVGSTQIVQWANSVYQVYDKATHASLLGPAQMHSTIFNQFPGVCSTSTHDFGDGSIQYDKLADRWVVMRPVNTGFLCIAVSATNDANRCLVSLCVRRTHIS